MLHAKESIKRYPLHAKFYLGDNTGDELRVNCAVNYESMLS